MAEIHSLEDTLRRHDVAMREWLSLIRVDYGANTDLHESVTISRDDRPILIVQAGPDRVVAAVVDLLVNSGWIAGDNLALQTATAQKLRDYANKNFAVLPLPLISMVRNDPTPNLQDSGVPKRFKRQRFDKAEQEWEIHQWPGAYETTYTVTFWALKRYTEVFFREWVYSQLGKRGVGEQEVLIPVIHNPPWGTIRQRLVLESSSDLSDLEGEKSRYMRFEYTFRLRTWHFRQPIGTTSYVHDLAVRELPVGSMFDSVDDDSGNPPIAPVSLNMFSIYMTQDLVAANWPRSGAATVRPSHLSPGGSPNGLRVTVETSADEVMLANRAVPLDPLGVAILSLAFDYRSSDADRVLVATQNPTVEPVVWITNRQFVLPQRWAWTKVQFFTLVKQPIFSVTVQGTGQPAVTYLENISLVHVRSMGRVDPDSGPVVGPGGTTYTFTDLVGANLFVIVFAAGAAAGTIDVGGTLYAVDPTTSVGLVAIFTPVAGAVMVTVPAAITSDDIYVQPYRGSWRGTDI